VAVRSRAGQRYVPYFGRAQVADCLPVLGREGQQSWRLALAAYWDLGLGCGDWSQTVKAAAPKAVAND
jgi:hypothetical protein